jgi:hypothetical protein
MTKTARKSTAKATKTEPKAPISIIEACGDPQIFAPWFRDKATWTGWFVVLKCMFGLPLDDAELVIFRKHTGRNTPAAGGYFDLSLVVGRRGGKSLILALIAAFLSCFFDWRPFLTGGERGTIVIIAADRRQAATIFRYLREMLAIPLLSGAIVRETNELLELNNSINIEIQTASYRTVRGRTVVAALCDELAFWRNDEGTSNPDTEIINALRPAMATIPGARLLKASSPYARRGILWTDYRKHYGVEDAATLVWQATTREMNPSVPQSFIDAAYADDAANAAAEYGGLFRTDLEAFVSKEVVDACTVPGRFELPMLKNVRTQYFAFVDPSGGSSDSMTLCVGHDENGIVVIDAIRERRPPFSPEGVVQEFAELLQSYGVRSVSGDRYGGEWPRERFKMYGVDYQVGVAPKSDLYRDLLPLLNGAKIELLDVPRLAAQLCGLERRTSRAGKDSIDHQPGGKDDLANCLAGVASLVCRTRYATRARYVYFDFMGR